MDYLSGLVTKYKEVLIPNQDNRTRTAGAGQQKGAGPASRHAEFAERADKKIIGREGEIVEDQCGRYCGMQHMKEEVERKKDEVKNMTMMILNDDRGFEGENS